MLISLSRLSLSSIAFLDFFRLGVSLEDELPSSLLLRPSLTVGEAFGEAFEDFSVLSNELRALSPLFRVEMLSAEFINLVKNVLSKFPSTYSDPAESYH